MSFEASAVTKKKRHKRLKYVAPSQEELKTEVFPLSLPISEEVTNALAKNNIDEAIRVIRTEPPSSRSLNILRQMQLIIAFNKNKKIPKIEKHKFCQNLGIAYHNLFLFLKRSNITNKEFYKNALKYYNKALDTLSHSEQSEVNLLIASLKASNGEIESAKKIFAKVDDSLIKDDSTTLEYLAAYYAAVGIEEKSVEALKKAYELNPEEIKTWVAIGDDFMNIEDTPKFKALVKSWKIKGRF